MHIRDDNRWGILSESTIREFEYSHGINLPKDYRSFLLEHHGGMPEPSFYWVVPNDWGSSIENLYGFGTNAYSLEEYYSSRAQLEVSDHLLPIGDDGCGSYICIAVQGSCRGAIFYVDHEYELDQPEKARCLADSFSEFLGRLSERPDY